MIGVDREAQPLHSAQSVFKERGKKSSVLAGALIVVWIVFTALVFWALQWQYVRAFQQDLPRNTVRWFESDALLGLFDQSVKAGSTGLAVHFWDPNCPCSRFSQSHIQDLIQQSLLQGVSSVVVVKASQGFWGGGELAKAKDVFSESDWVIAAESVPELTGRLAGSPSAAILDTDKNIRYIGPYSSDAFCSTSGDGFVEKALIELKQVDPHLRSPQALTSACFCDW